MAKNTRINLDNWTPIDTSNPLASLAHEVGEAIDAVEKKIPPTSTGFGFASGYVNAGQFVTLDNIKATVTTTGNRGLSVATVSGTFTASISATYSCTGGGNGHSTAWPGATYTTTPSGSWFNYHFPNAGDGSTYLVNDYNNKKFYRIHLMIGVGYTNNFISIERLA